MFACFPLLDKFRLPCRASRYLLIAALLPILLSVYPGPPAVGAAEKTARLLVLGDMSIQGNIKPVRSLMEPLQVAMDNGFWRSLTQTLIEWICGSSASKLTVTRSSPDFARRLAWSLSKDAFVVKAVSTPRAESIPTSLGTSGLSRGSPPVILTLVRPSGRHAPTNLSICSNDKRALLGRKVCSSPNLSLGMQ